jgi:hypothetical protein
MTLVKTLAAAAAGTVLATSAFAESAREVRAVSPGAGFTPAQTTDLFLLEALDDVSRTRKLAEGDRNALRAVADWTKTFVAKPHRDLGRAGAGVSVRACGLGS